MKQRQPKGQNIREYSAPIVRQNRLSWQGGTAESIVRNSAGDVDFRLVADRYALYFTSRTATTGETEYDGKSMQIEPIPHVGIYPAGGELRGRCKADNSAYLALFLETDFMLSGIGAAHLTNYSLRPVRQEGDELCWGLANVIRKECEDGAPLGNMYAETMATALSNQILRLYSNIDDVYLRPQQGGLSPAGLRRVQDYMQARIGDDISLADVAAISGLSLAHFARSFRLSTGHPPHRWLMLRRIDHAKDLMLNTGMALCDIALACGFAEQSHFTRVFRQLTGTSPGARQREKRS